MGELIQQGLSCIGTPPYDIRVPLHEPRVGRGGIVSAARVAIGLMLPRLRLPVRHSHRAQSPWPELRGSHGP